MAHAIFRMDPMTLTGAGMPIQVDDTTILRAPATVLERASGAMVAIDPASPHWIATDERGTAILRHLDGRTPLGEIARRYGA